MGKAKKKEPEPDQEATSPPIQPVPIPPQIYEAQLGDQGRVHRIGSPITEADAVNLRRSGKDVVVCGSILKDNRRMAQKIEIQASGGYLPHLPHPNAGVYAMPHYQPITRPPFGHTFYETNSHKAAK